MKRVLKALTISIAAVTVAFLIGVVLFVIKETFSVTAVLWLSAVIIFGGIFFVVYKSIEE